MTEINRDSVNAAITEPDPTLEALGLLLKEVSADMVRTLASVLAMTGHNPTGMPAEFLLQAVLVEAEKVFNPISRDNWIKIYDSYHAVKAVIEANPDIQAALAARRELLRSGAQVPTGVPVPEVVDSLLDGQF